jgi:hypothetical protein
VEDDAALALIAEDVRPRLERAAEMHELKKLYSAAAQEAFDDLSGYVLEWYAADAKDDKLRALIAELRKLLDEYDV